MLAPPSPPLLSARSDDDLMGLLESEARTDVLTELRARYGRPVFHRHLAMTGNHLDADELTEETFSRVYFKRHLYRPGGRFLGWLGAVARRLALTHLKNRDRRPRPMSSLPAGADDPEEDPLAALDDGRVHREVEEREFARMLEEAIQALPPPQRQAFELCVVEGLPYAQAAATLGVPQGTIAVRVMRARRKLVTLLAAVLDGPGNARPARRSIRKV